MKKSKKKGTKPFWNHTIFSTGNVIGATIVLVIAALVAWVPNPFKTKGATVEINVENLLFVRYLSDKPHLDKRLGLMAYGLTIINTSDDPLTIKDVRLNCSLGGKVETLSPRHVYTQVSKKGKPCATVLDGDGIRICFADWFNIVEVVHENKLLTKGQILRGSAFYLFPTTDATAVREIYNSMSMDVVDYNGNATEVPFTYPLRYDSILQQDVINILSLPEKP